MRQLENIEAIERRLWAAADQLRANSNFASNEYFMPVMGLVFLRYAYSRYLMVKDEVEKSLPSRQGQKRPATKEDFSARSAIFLRPEAQFDNLVALPSGSNIAEAVVHAMQTVETDYESLKGVFPKSEYQELDDDLLAGMLRTLNPDELKKVTGDVFGRIYEYFLTQFADQKAHDGGEFFTPISLVSFIAHVLDPVSGIVFDPACGSGGMFVQSARVVEQNNQNPTEQLIFYGYEKNPTTINLAKMNLAVHGLEGNIQKAITYYEDPLNLFGKCDYVMANPPFNVDEVDSEKIKTDPRLPLGLPGISKSKDRFGKVSNGNYLWISYFYSYLNKTGRAGFVMSSQASSAGNDEAVVRRKLVESGSVEIMVAIRSNFFYTRSVPCELWFLNKAKPDELKDKVLMIDARNIFRQVSRKICDFSPEQMHNLLCIVWLYRGQTDRFWDQVRAYLTKTVFEGEACFEADEEGCESLPDFSEALTNLKEEMSPFFGSLPTDSTASPIWLEFLQSLDELELQALDFEKQLVDANNATKKIDTLGHKRVYESLTSSADLAKDLVTTSDHAVKLANRLIDLAEKELDAKKSGVWPSGPINRLRKQSEETRKIAVDQLKQVRYFHRQAHWLLDHFPDGQLRDVEGLVKVVDHASLESADWSLSPGRYVGVAPELEDEDFDFEEAIRAIHEELKSLNEEADELTLQIDRSLGDLLA